MMSEFLDELTESEIASLVTTAKRYCYAVAYSSDGDLVAFNAQAFDKDYVFSTAYLLASREGDVLAYA